MPQVWQGICSTWHLVTKGICWSIGDGKQVHFWKDSWLRSGPILHSITNHQLGPNIEDDLVSNMTREGVWATDLFHQHVSPMVLNEILATIPPKADRGNDKVAWSLTNNGAFSTKSGYHLISKNDPGPNHVVWKSIWKAKVPHRYKSFLWKILKGGLMTNSARLDRNFSTYDTCPMCQTKSESTIHVLRDCDTAKTL
ncbi:Reverse transcriptase zinc-binding domain [Sesbania bispinosa]|nr:Reverse transcriptase zinc-binding domain [Sesbania bispinosa]